MKALLFCFHESVAMDKKENTNEMGSAMKLFFMSKLV